MPGKGASQSGDVNRNDEIASLIQDVVGRRRAGEDLPDDSVIAAHPEFMPELEGQLGKLPSGEQAGQKVRIGSTDMHAASRT